MTALMLSMSAAAVWLTALGKSLAYGWLGVAGSALCSALLGSALHALSGAPARADALRPPRTPRDRLEFRLAA